MNNEIVAIYCLCDDMLRAMNHQGEPQEQMSDAEVMTTAWQCCILVEILRRQENICQSHNTSRKWLVEVV